MCKTVLLMIICGILFFTACPQENSQQEGNTHNQLSYTHSIIRVSRGGYQEQSPKVFLTYNEFNQYLYGNWTFSRRQIGSPYLDYAEQLRRSEDFFDDYFIVTLVIVEGNCSTIHRLDSVDYNGNINMTRFTSKFPPTMAMAQMYVEIVLSNEYIPSEFRLNMTTDGSPRDGFPEVDRD